MLVYNNKLYRRRCYSLVFFLFLILCTHDIIITYPLIVNAALPTAKTPAKTAKERQMQQRPAPTTGWGADGKRSKRSTDRLVSEYSEYSEYN